MKDIDQESFLGLVKSKLRPQDLVGTWRLKRCVVRFSDGRPEHFPFGEEALGQLIYSIDGYMSATLSENERRPHQAVKLESARKATIEERASAYDSYMTYDGLWSLEHDETHLCPSREGALGWGRRARLTHEVIRALTPNAIGQMNRREAVLMDGFLTLSYSKTPLSGVRRDYELVWQRERPSLSLSSRPRCNHADQGERWLAKHELMLAKAIEISAKRSAWTPFIESPSRKFHPELAKEEGLSAFQSRLGRLFHFSSPLAGAKLQREEDQAWVGDEVSPYTMASLEIKYPEVDVERLFAEVDLAWESWKWAPHESRVGVCLEILTRWSVASFEIAFSTMHTAGQAFMLAFAGSGASSLDRGLEALCAAWLALESIPSEAQYERRFGKGEPAQLLKRYHRVPVGAAVIFSCGSYPAWNAYPAMMANLATGNPVVIKPHPDTILPMAIAIDIARETMREAGYDPNIITMAPDTWENPVGLKLVDHPQTKIVDFTGGQRFGALLERRDPQLQVYTETAGCNAVLLESTDDLDATLNALAQGLSLFSAQMCTAPQNLWVSASGFKVYTRPTHDSPRELSQCLSPSELAKLLKDRVDHLLSDPQRAAGICGVLHSEQSIEEMKRVGREVLALGGSIIREGRGYDHPDHPRARTATPLICALDSANRAPAQAERFGPISFVITADDEESLFRLAAGDAGRFGSIAAYAYSVNSSWVDKAERAFITSGASLGINLHRQSPMHYTAAFSDFHVTGLNPAGSASLTDLAFVSRRFRVVQSKRELS